MSIKVAGDLSFSKTGVGDQFKHHTQNITLMLCIMPRVELREMRTIPKKY